MNVIENAYLNLKKHVNFKSTDVIVGAISGGPDSMCLLDLLVKLKKEFDLIVICAHVNHKVRIESDDEYIFVKNYCKNNDIIFEGMEIDSIINGNFEAEARKIRYNFFKKIMNKYNAKFLFTAHHGDDLMETILMRIVRGSNINGYYGFSLISNFNSGLLIRPLISVTKANIIKYNRENNIPWADDYTNKDDVHTRNRYRKYILPKLKEENENVNLKFLQYSEDIKEVSDYIECQTKDMLKEVYTNKIDIDKFKKYNHLLQINGLFIILSRIYQDEINLINRKHVNSIYKLVYSNDPNKKIDLPGKYIVCKKYNFVYFELDKKKNEYCIELNKKIIKLPNGKTLEQIDRSLQTDNFICYLSSKEIKLPLIIRTKQLGDVVYVKNLKGKVKLKKIFIDSKIDFNTRSEWPIVTDAENTILWIPGLKKTKYDKQKAQKYDIILKYY